MLSLFRGWYVRGVYFGDFRWDTDKLNYWHVLNPSNVIHREIQNFVPNNLRLPNHRENCDCNVSRNVVKDSTSNTSKSLKAKNKKWDSYPSTWKRLLFCESNAVDIEVQMNASLTQVGPLKRYKPAYIWQPNLVDAIYRFLHSVIMLATVAILSDTNRNILCVSACNTKSSGINLPARTSTNRLTQSSKEIKMSLCGSQAEIYLSECVIKRVAIWLLRMLHRNYVLVEARSNVRQGEIWAHRSFKSASIFKCQNCVYKGNKSNIKWKTNKIHTHHVFHFTYLHVSVTLYHLQGAFWYKMHYCLNVQVQYTRISIYGGME